MRHENSLFHALAKHIPWAEFERLVAAHKADHGVRRLDSKSQLVALLFGQFAGASSLREIEAGLTSHQARLYHLGARRPARSTLADANAKRPWALYADLFAHMAGQANRSTRRKLADATRIIDASKAKLSALSAEWARFSDDHCAAKLKAMLRKAAGRTIDGLWSAIGKIIETFTLARISHSAGCIGPKNQ